jgi:hypothetical protein
LLWSGSKQFLSLYPSWTMSYNNMHTSPCFSHIQYIPGMDRLVLCWCVCMLLSSVHLLRR